MDLTNDFRVGVPVDQAWDVLIDLERIAPCMPGAQLQEIEGDEYRGVVKVKVGPITAQYKGVARFLERDDAAHKAVLRAEGRETRGQGNANATITALLEPDGDGTKVSVVTDLTVTGRVAQFGRGVMADVSSRLMGQFADCLGEKLASGEAEGAAAPEAGAAPAGGAPASGAPASGVGAATSAAPGETSAAESEGTSAGGTGGASVQVEAADESAAAEAPTASAAGSPAPSSASPNGSSSPGVRVVNSPEAEPVDLLDAAGAPVAKRVGPAVAGLTALWLLSIFLRRRRRK